VRADAEITRGTCRIMQQPQVRSRFFDAVVEIIRRKIEREGKAAQQIAPERHHRFIVRVDRGFEARKVGSHIGS